MVAHVANSDEWDQYISKSKSFGGKGIVVDFTAQWCGPCQAIGPYFEQLSKDPSYSQLTFLKVDVDECSDVAQAAGVRAMPTFKTYFNGEEVEELVGADKAKLKALIDRLAQKSVTLGEGRKLGGGEASSSPAAPDSADERRRRMAEAAEARLKAQA